MRRLAVSLRLPLSHVTSFFLFNATLISILNQTLINEAPSRKGRVFFASCAIWALGSTINAPSGSWRSAAEEK